MKRYNNVEHDGISLLWGLLMQAVGSAGHPIIQGETQFSIKTTDIILGPGDKLVNKAGITTLLYNLRAKGKKKNLIYILYYRFILTMPAVLLFCLNFILFFALGNTSGRVS